MSRAARSRRAGHSGSPARRRAMLRALPGEITGSPSTRTATRSGAGSGRKTTSTPPSPSAAAQLHEDVLEAPGREHQLDRAAHGLAVEGPAGHEAHERLQAFLRRRLHPDRADELLAAGADGGGSGASGRDEGQDEEGALEHQRDCRIRTSNAQPRSTPVLAVPGSDQVSSSEKRSVSVYSTARIRSSVPRRSCE